MITFSVILTISVLALFLVLRKSLFTFGMDKHFEVYTVGQDTLLSAAGKVEYMSNLSHGQIKSEL